MKMPGMLGTRKNGLSRGNVIGRGQINRGMQTQVITWWHWLAIPAIISLGATIVLATAFQPFGFYLPEPVTPFILAFAWPLIRPSYIAPFFLAALGLFLDIYWGAPIGLWTLSLMLVYGVLVSLRTYIIGQEWIVLLGIFLLTELAFFTVGTLLVTLDSGAVPRLWGVVEQAFATGLLFPVVLYLMEKYLHSDVRFK